MTLKKKQDSYLRDIQFAYYRGRWVFVPVFYIPKNALGDDGYLHSIQLIPVNGKKLSSPPLRRSCEEAYKFIGSRIKETILPWMLSADEIKELCTINDIPVSWVTGIQRNVSTKKTIGKSSRRKMRKYYFLKQIEYKKFITKLSKISLQHTLVAEILWFLNEQLQLGDSYITLEEVLRVKIDDVDSEDGITTCIRLYRRTSQGNQHLTHWLPGYIWIPLCKLIKENSLFVFSNRNHGPLLPSDVCRSFKKAGKLAGINETVCSLSLRPIGTFSPVKCDESKNQTNIDDFRLKEISIQEWKVLCHQVPNIMNRRGRPSQHNPRDICNALLYYLRTGTPIRKLPDSYPHYRAIHSQYRRWQENGIFEAILAARK